MKKEYLSEAFRQLELLNEEDFNLSTTADNSDLKDFLDNDDMSVMSLDVIDPEAETEEDLEDSYTGKVILDCCVCHSKLYKDKEEVQIDEEQDLANVGEECPFCYSNDGFKIIGEVAPYGETEVEPKEDEDIEHEDIEHEEDDKNNTNESLKSRKNRKLKESYEKEGYYAKIVHDTLIKVGVDYIDIGADQEGDSIIVRVYNETPYTSDDLRKVWLKLHTPEAEDCDISEDEDGDSVMIFEFSLEDEDDDDFEESLNPDKNNSLRNVKRAIKSRKTNSVSESIKKGLALKEGFMGQTLDDFLGDWNNAENISIWCYDENEDGPVFEGDVSDIPDKYLNAQFDDFDTEGKIYVNISDVDEDFDESLTTRKNRKNRKLKESLRGADAELIADEDDIRDYLSDDDDEDLRIALKHLGDMGTVIDDSIHVTVRFSDGDRITLPKMFFEFYTYESLTTRRNKSVNESEEGKKLFTEYKILVDGRTYEISHTKQRADEIVPILKDMYPDSEIEAKPYKHYASGIERKRLERQIADQLKEYGVNESVNESIQEIEIETDTDKIKIESEPKEESGETEDILAPVSPETEQQIENNSSDEIDVPIDEFDEETFDELGESFLKNTYENVKSYKTESIKEQDGNKLVVEGLITFSSGKVKKTSFIFEAKDITKSGKVRFIGENCQLSRGKKSFTVAGKVQEGKFISESLNYNYRAKDAKSGKSTRMYGTVRTNK